MAVSGRGAQRSTASNAPADGSPITIAVLVEGVADDG